MDVQKDNTPDFKCFFKSNGEIASAESLSKVLPRWVGDAERWLFVSAHDDDAVIGAGLTILAAVAAGVQAHAVITTDGRMGYCSDEERATIAEIRRKEATRAYRMLGLPVEHIHFLDFVDCDLMRYVGRRPALNGDHGVVQGYAGLQNAFTWILRQACPTRVFLPTIADLHPDHRIVNEEMLISLFHAQGSIWPELGEPLDGVPQPYEYATYCDFPELPQLKIASSDAQMARKMEALAAFASQKQIDLTISQLRKGGPVEYIREVHFDIYSPQNYVDLF